MKKELIYIGADFYYTSSLYEEIKKGESYKRYDWGFVESDLNNGIEIKIKPATIKQLKYFEGKLKKIREDYNK